MSFLIRAGIALYHAVVHVAAMFSPKARKWVEGRKELWTRLEARAVDLEGCIWMHCASAGEYEQGMPVLERIRAEHPERPVLLTFFSPSGMEAYHDHPLATHVEYLPADGAQNADRFLRTVRPSAALFVRYEFWYDHLTALKEAGVPTFLISSIFRPSQPFFRFYGAAHRRMLKAFTRIFVQDDRSMDLLEGLGITNALLTGDTRFDRVMEIVNSDTTIPLVAAFRKASDRPVIVAGSTWPADDTLIQRSIAALNAAPRLVVAPHETDASTDQRMEARYPAPLVRYSALDAELQEDHPRVKDPNAPVQDPLLASTLHIDRMGLLSRVYQYGDIAYIGGGFGSGIHNLLEAAAWGIPVIFGPQHEPFAEAKGLIAVGGGFCVHDQQELSALLRQLLTNRNALELAGHAAGTYVAERTGATERTVIGLRPYLAPAASTSSRS